MSCFVVEVEIYKKERLIFFPILGSEGSAQDTLQQTSYWESGNSAQQLENLDLEGKNCFKTVNNFYRILKRVMW